MADYPTVWRLRRAESPGVVGRGRTTIRGYEKLWPSAKRDQGAFGAHVFNLSAAKFHCINQLKNKSRWLKIFQLRPSTFALNM